MNNNSFIIGSLLKRYRGFIGWFLFGVFTLGLIIVFVSYAFYTFTIKGEYSSIEVSDENDKSSRVLSIFGLHFIPRGSMLVSINSSDSQTRISLTDKPLLGIKHEEIEIKKQYTTTKIGKGSLGCDSKTKDRYFTYSCSGATSNVLFYSNSRDPNLKFTNDRTSLEYQVGDVRYRDGLLRFKESGESKGIYTISYLDPSGEAATTDTLKLDLGDKYKYDIKVLPSNINDGSFSVVGPNGNIYYFSFIGSEPRVAKRKIALDDKSRTPYLCNATFKKVVCFYGTLDPRGTNEHELNNKKLAADKISPISSIEIYDFTTNKIITKQANEKYIDDICLIDNKIFFKSDNKLSEAIIEGNSIREKGVIIPDIRSIGCGNNLTYATDSGIYTYTNNHSHLAFYVPRINIVSFYSLGKNVIFNGSINPDRTLHTYQLNIGMPVKGVGRIESKLPYLADNTLILDSDYDDVAIYIKPSTSFISDHQTGKTSYDQAALNKSKTQIQKRLEADGLADKYQVRYFSYN